MKTHRLWGMRCYLSGAMDNSDDNGKGWRKRITPFLESLGVVVLNPCEKPMPPNPELIEVEKRDFRETLKISRDFDTLSSRFGLLRVLDLRMVDMADFLIINLDNDIPSCGTYEEMVRANSMKNPILIRCVQGKTKIPNWIWGMIPHEHVFGTWKDLKHYLLHVNSDEEVDHMKRWMFFDYSQLIPKVSVEEAILNTVVK